MARTESPTCTADESANVTVGRSDTDLSIWMTATSCATLTPTTCAEYVCDCPSTVTVMLDEPVTTWLLVRISPVELMIMPVPAAWPLPSVVLMSTIAGMTFAAAASSEPPLEELGEGVTCVIGDSGLVVGCCDACAVWCVLLLTARARLHPMP